MAKQLRVTLELGPKGKRVVAVAPDWPGLERGAKTSDAAIETLQRYVERYAKVAKRAKVAGDFGDWDGVDVVEQYTGTGSTDFWGISFAFSSIDEQPMSKEECERELKLLRACWAYFDEVRARVTAEMKKGARGGGRDRDHIVRHVVGVEQDWAKKVGVLLPAEEITTDENLRVYRDDYCLAIRQFHTENKLARTWPLRFLIRHSAFHTMDHAWEMEDKDLSNVGP